MKMYGALWNTITVVLQVSVLDLLMKWIVCYRLSKYAKGVWLQVQKYPGQTFVQIPFPYFLYY